VAAAVMRMIEKDPEHRWPSLEAAVKAIGLPQHAGLDDPIREEMAKLGSSGSVPKMLALSHTPLSPLPQITSGPRPAGSRSNPNAVTIPVTASGSVRKVRRGLHLSGPAWAGIGGIVMVAALYLLGVFRHAPVVVPPLGPPAAQSTAESATSHKPEPVKRAEPRRPPKATPAPVVSRAPALPADPRTDTVATHAAIDVVIATFRKAIESRDLSKVALAYPGLTVKQQREFTDLFARAENLRMTLVVEKTNKLEVSSAEITMRGSYQYTDRSSHRTKLEDYKKKATLAFAGGVWRLSEVH
jgi:hypothetical protein